MGNFEQAAQGGPSPAPVAADGKTAREQVLEQCMAESAAWEEKPKRNLVLLFDGTGNIIGNHQDTNIVRLLRTLRQDASQLVYYDPGVGTSNDFPASSWSTKIAKTVRQLAGMALGSGAFQNIAEAYEFLVHNYQEGDRIFLFGFSRGAFTARAVGGMINMYGLVYPNALSMTKLLVSNYFASSDQTSPSGKTKIDFASDIIANFSLGRCPLIHFTGVWDSVETIGSGFLGGIKITNTSDILAKRFVHVRHALALHETRCKYTPRRYAVPAFSDAEKRYRSLDERWFRGVHSDVGGSYDRAGLALLSLNWMVAEASAQGLVADRQGLEPGRADVAMHDQIYESPYWIWTGVNARQRNKNDVIDRSALPLDGAVAADTVARSAPLVTLAGWVLTALVLALAVIASRASESACTFSNLPWWLSGAQGMFQALSPWHAGFGAVCDKVDAAIFWDWWFMLAYVLWLPFPLVWALRRLAARAILAGQSLTRLQRSAQRILTTLIVADAAENLLTPAMAGFGWLVALASVIKIGAFLLLASICIAGMFTTKAAPVLEEDEAAAAS